mmetsp:Transcript_62780/g.137238  ORF Transcript_62780/g.137238 Transcript_62780/m.137238 type:complete len:135 (+) Transcript_62780:618-1022(+)
MAAPRLRSVSPWPAIRRPGGDSTDRWLGLGTTDFCEEDRPLLRGELEPAGDRPGEVCVRRKLRLLLFRLLGEEMEELLGSSVSRLCNDAGRGPCQAILGLLQALLFVGDVADGAGLQSDRLILHGIGSEGFCSS